MKQKFHAAVRNVYRHAMRHANALSDATNVQAYDGNFISVTFMRHRVAHGDDIPTFHPTAHDPVRRHRGSPDRCADGPPPQSVPTAPQQNIAGDSTTLTPEQLDRQWEGARDAAPAGAAGAAGAEPAQPAAADQGAGYADLADLVLAAPVIADATISLDRADQGRRGGGCRTRARPFLRRGRRDRADLAAVVGWHQGSAICLMLHRIPTVAYQS
ncbi:hypothetical protein [Sphingomonas aerolata]|uniref:hypothetical protein n=1 Tax=Sphingomonas aerolata TaxID=185951 RepID=UPI003A5BC6E1